MSGTQGSSRSPMGRRTLLRSIAAGGAALAAPSVLTACSTGSGSGGDVSNAGKKSAPWPTYTPTEGPAPDLAPSTAGVQAGYTTYPQKLVTATDGKPGTGKEKIRVLSITYGTPPKPAGSNKYWQAMNDALGVEVEFTVVPDADFRAKMATLMAGDSDDLPDIISIGGGYVLPREAQFVKTRCADLSEHLSGDAVKDYPNLAGIPTYAWEGMGRIGGRVYGVPVERAKVQGAMFINREAFDKAGYRPGMTADAFRAMAKEASGDKKHALGASTVGFYGYHYHAMWHGAPNEWRIKGGRVTPMYGTDEFKAALEFMARLRADGSYNSDATSISQVDLKTQFYNGTVRSMTDGWGAALSNAQGIKDAYTLDVAEPYAVSGATPVYQQNRGCFGYTVIKKASKNRVQLMLRVLDWLASPFGSKEYELMHYGVEGTHFAYDKAGDPIPTERGLVESRTNLPFAYLMDAPQPLYFPGHPDLTKRLHAWEKKVVPLLVPNDRWGLQSATFNRVGASLQQIVEDGVTAVVSGRKSPSSWDGVVKKWRAQGGDKCVEEFEEEYEAAR
ncbi:sugar ABC transporter substrate-binding protein [Streptomyces lasiicapitis]|uniref:Sugar ABC transporter substrate-binding protein n=2 Tax=Streptomyces lasiicapitis TaxID=1923961 RepID=A0ABQ2M1X9_9ACTN|nr:sugar ABC transporter substrate-binding protein [Streptomyces lasiicapitis]